MSGLGSGDLGWDCAESNSERHADDAADPTDSDRLRFPEAATCGATTTSDEAVRSGWLCCFVAEVVSPAI